MTTSNATDHQPNNQPRDAYRRELTHQIFAGLQRAARHGWTPDDLRHVLTSQVDHLLYLAAHQVCNHTRGPGSTAVCEPVRAAWLSQAHATEEIHLPTGSMEEIVHFLNRVPPLHDQVLLTDTQAVDGRAHAFEALSPEQRKAQHRIIALLQKAESTNFAGEAEVLVAKAQQLRQRYRIESVLLNQELGGAPPATEFFAQRVYLHAPWIRHQFSLLARVAATNSAAAMLLTRKGIATVVGQLDDVRHVTDLFASLNRQRDHFMRTSAGAHEATRRGETAAYRRNFMIAYTAQISVLLGDAARRAAADDLAHRRTLPVLASRGEQAARRLAELFPRSRKMAFSADHPGGHRDGVTAARQTRLGGDSAGLDPMAA